MFRRFAALEKLPASRSVCIYWKGLSAMVTVVPKKNVQEGEENFVGDSEIIALGGASNETKDRPLG